MPAIPFTVPGFVFSLSRTTTVATREGRTTWGARVMVEVPGETVDCGELIGVSFGFAAGPWELSKAPSSTSTNEQALITESSK
jgi:hypothetical protein